MRRLERDLRQLNMQVAHELSKYGELAEEKQFLAP